jgi:hypothetical protein
LFVQGAMSVRAIGKTINYDHGYLSRVFAGKQKPSAALLAALEEVGVVPTAPTLDSLAEHLSGLRHQEDVVGVARIREPAIAFGKRITELADDARAGERQGMVHLAGQSCSYLGWVELESKNFEQSRRWLERGAMYASEVGDDTLWAHIVAFMATLEGRRSKPLALEGLARASLRRPSIHPAQQSYNGLQHARSLALIGEGQHAGRSLDASTALSARATSEEPLPYAYWYTSAFLTLNTGYVHLELGHLSQARDLMDAGLSDLPPDQRDSDWAAEYKEALART